MKEKIIFTLGHSTRTTQEFLEILDAFDIQVLVDIRHYPGSRYCPQFNQEEMKEYLVEAGIEYVHLLNLGGRRRRDKNSEDNAGWRSPQFRGYADYMQTQEFNQGLKELIRIASLQRVAIMCSEAVPWRCHRSMVADALLVNGFKVYDIFNEKKSLIHHITPFAQVKRKKILYPKVENHQELPKD